MTPSERAELLQLPDAVPLTTEEVAGALRISKSLLWKMSCWKRDGDLVPYAKRAGRNLYRPSDVRAWLDAGRIGGKGGHAST